MNRTFVACFIVGIFGGVLFWGGTEVNATTDSIEKSPVSVSFVADPDSGEEFKPSTPETETKNEPDNVVVNQDKPKKVVTNVVNLDESLAAISTKTEETGALPQAGYSKLGLTIPLMTVFFSAGGFLFLKKSTWLND